MIKKIIRKFFEVRNLFNFFEEKYVNQRNGFVLIKGKKYKINLTEKEHKINDVYIAKTLTTQEQWTEIMGGNPSYFQGEKKPVENVSWIESLEFCNRLSRIENKEEAYEIENGKLVSIKYFDGEKVKPDSADFSKVEGYRLLLEIEWDFCSQDASEIEKLAWYEGNSSGETKDVATKSPNGVGIYDLNENVWEWVYDTENTIGKSTEKAYIYDEKSHLRRRRGGAWDSRKNIITTLNRGNGSYTDKSNNIGFRVCCTKVLEKTSL